MPARPTPGPSDPGNPCTAALASAAGVVAAASTASSKRDGYGHDDRDPREFLALHLLPRDADVASRASSSSAVRSGDIAVLADDGSLVIGANPFDLGGAVVRFDPDDQAGYDVRRASGASAATWARGSLSSTTTRASGRYRLLLPEGDAVFGGT